MRTVIDWIPVEERLPQRGPVLVWWRPEALDRFELGVGSFYTPDEWLNFTGGYFCNVSHWAPVPGLPEAK